MGRMLVLLVGLVLLLAMVAVEEELEFTFTVTDGTVEFVDDVVEALTTEDTPLSKTKRFISFVRTCQQTDRTAKMYQRKIL